MDIENLFTLGTGVVISGLLLATGHWMPWELTRIQAYVYGTVSLWIGFAFWRGTQGDWETPLGFLVMAVLGGAVVKLAYTADSITREVREARMRRAVDDASDE